MNVSAGNGGHYDNVNAILINLQNKCGNFTYEDFDGLNDNVNIYVLYNSFFGMTFFDEKCKYAYSQKFDVKSAKNNLDQLNTFRSSIVFIDI